MNRTLYVCHSGQVMDLSALEDLFTTVGDVLGAKFEARFGVIEMSTAQQAIDCRERFHGHLFNGHTLSVETVPRRQKKKL